MCDFEIFYMTIKDDGDKSLYYEPFFIKFIMQPYLIHNFFDFRMNISGLQALSRVFNCNNSCEERRGRIARKNCNLMIRMVLFDIINILSITIHNN